MRIEPLNLKIVLSATIWHLTAKLFAALSLRADMMIIEMFPLGYFGLLLVRYWRDNNQSKHI